MKQNNLTNEIKSEEAVEFDEFSDDNNISAS